MFSAEHGNLDTAAAMAITSVGSARALMRLQKGVDGTTLINVPPKALPVPAALETLAQQIVSEVAAVELVNVNPFAGGFDVIAEPRLDADSATAWYLFADPGRQMGLTLAKLADEPEPFIESQLGWRVDGTEFKVRFTRACGWVDYRGAVKNPGHA